MLISNGAIVKSPSVLWSGTTASPDWPIRGHHLSLNQWAGYAEMYRKQTWVRVTVDKLAGMTLRLPLKVYERADRGRPEVRDHPYAHLLAHPNERHSRQFFWMWTSSTFDIFGEVFWAKIRDAGGRPVQLLPLHPTCMHPEDKPNADGETLWTFQNGSVRVEGIRQSDLVHIRNYNPDSMQRGLSKLESLRRTLEFEDAAQRSQSSLYRNGARPSMALKAKGNLSKEAGDRLKAQWDCIATGVDKVGTTVVLEEGLEPEALTMSAKDSEYIDSRKLNREEVVAAYDMPPPAVHILDHATFSNITEQFRSVYRDTMGPRLQLFEGTLETELRGSVRPGNDEPDFGSNVYAEFLLDEVLRGDFEQRAEAYQKAEHMTLAEKRDRENLPFIEGTDRIFINSATKPVAGEDMGGGDDEQIERAGAVGQAVQRLGLGVNYGVLSEDEAHALLPNIDGPAPSGAETRSVMGRLSRVKSLAEVDGVALVAGLNGSSGQVLAELARARAENETVAGFRDRLKTLEV